ncbi:MAG: peptide-methionine (S)-S-oxide reductase MsrA [Candidatus Poseidoniales archaeon]|jgi:peptide-methionine (S)-S-oxide reductase|tara:strand:- start:362 stop:883 length:522 start_codon:yes stop_codon:yes gene_type:complete
MEEAIIGGGCFWCTEGALKGLKGVINIIPGYCGGNIINPTYEQICSKNTGHAEVVKISFNPGIITFKAILEVFFTSHDPTQMNRQGNDVGPQYRSIAFYLNDEQHEDIKLVINNLQTVTNKKIVTEVVEIRDFYEAEKYHHNYYSKNSYQPYCEMVVAPKIKKVREKYANLYE